MTSSITWLIYAHTLNFADDIDTAADDDDDESMSKRKVAYYYDSKLPILASPSTSQPTTNHSWCRSIHIRTRPPHETTQNTGYSWPSNGLRHARQNAHSGERDTIMAFLNYKNQTPQRPKRATPEVMSSFHTDEYVHFLHSVTPETAEKMTYQGTRCMSFFWTVVLIKF